MGDIKEVVPKITKFKKGKPISSFKLTFDSQQVQPEPIYYWLLDFVQDGGWETKKITDNFSASPGSGQFADIGQRVTRMQEEGMKILGGLNQVIKSSLNLIYDLKEFKMRLVHYDDSKSDSKQTRESGMLALKQIWLDSVDLKRGRGSIHQLAAEGGYTTIREVFMMANSINDLKKMNKEDKDGGGIINDQILRMLIPRLAEFNKWVEYSEKELRKRFNIERSYLKSQVETIKLYSSWMKPYLKAAEELRQKGFEGNAALVSAFSTSMFELTLFGKRKVSVPEKFGNAKLKRDYYSCILISLVYRGHLSRRETQQGDYGFVMGGRIDMTFDSYALNSEEMELMEKELTKEDVEDTLKFSSDVAGDALAELKDDLDEFLTDEDDKKEEKKKKKKENDINPFSALFSLFKPSSKKKGKKKEIANLKSIKADNFVERAVRANAAQSAADGIYLVYDIYKKSHGMASSPEGFENSDEAETTEPAVEFKDVFKK
ncbi:hypothetical protein HOA55_02710 [archaeon]|jgi:hypothetical protein|nr:hypothetical protein [archaeon]MBT3577231.1 hypothetical protein [archaeon]MBT6820240.1 hypothetical protein [archaeon]MBT6956729.1 hypothetical protein [archaeon]MBT7025444.1 hypothetical protein [archaeon]